MAKALNRPAVYLRGLQARFELPILGEAQYPDSYLGFLRTVMFLRMLNVSEETLRDLWRLEKKLLRLLNMDATGSKTWYLDACGQTAHSDSRLLLSNYDLGVKLPSGTLQLGLNFQSKLPEFFAGSEMGESAIRVLGDYLKLYARIQTGISAEAPLLRSAAGWSRRLK